MYYTYVYMYVSTYVYPHHHNALSSLLPSHTHTQSVPLVIGQFNEMIDAHYGIVGSTAGSTYYVRILSTLDREKLKPNVSVALHRHSHSVVDILPPESDSTIQVCW